MKKQSLADWPDPTAKTLHIYRLFCQDPTMFARHRSTIEACGGFWASTESSPHLLAKFAPPLAPLLVLHWRWAERALRLDAAPAADNAALRDALARLRIYHGKAVPPDLRRQVHRSHPQLAVAEPWNTTPNGRWRAAREREALHDALNAEVRAAYAPRWQAAKEARVAKRKAQMESYSPEQLHRIAEREMKRGGRNALEWAHHADAAAKALGMSSRFEHDDRRIAAAAADAMGREVRKQQREIRGVIRRLRRAAARADRLGDHAAATRYRQQAADYNRVVICPITGERTMSHEPPPRSFNRLAPGGARPGAGRKPLFAPAPPDADPSLTMHADPTVANARRWAHHAGYLAKHFSYCTKTGEVTGPSGRALDLRHPVSTPLGALRPGLLLAALLHGTVTRRYSLPRGAGAASAWPLHTLAVTVVDAERDAGLAQPGTPAHLLVPPAPRERRGGGR